MCLAWVFFARCCNTAPIPCRSPKFGRWRWMCGADGRMVDFVPSFLFLSQRFSWCCLWERKLSLRSRPELFHVIGIEGSIFFYNDAMNQDAGCRPRRGKKRRMKKRDSSDGFLGVPPHWFFRPPNSKKQSRWFIFNLAKLKFVDWLSQTSSYLSPC
ncbi:hypothetical protein L873DRAFT_110135 [Choiromyces venosus 120613-1]|uniref:Uncharacterized protein n=1 Tax=Choiromyces venosus 120613-1 TaxID=1336337 RepID=A0A3N4JGR0_9PEZI|nr:hypothetical protein L873DRAFT_110135 [Choiromyces venosus 120613-1]